MSNRLEFETLVIPVIDNPYVSGNISFVGGIHENVFFKNVDVVASLHVTCPNFEDQAELLFQLESEENGHAGMACLKDYGTENHPKDLKDCGFCFERTEKFREETTIRLFHNRLRGRAKAKNIAFKVFLRIFNGALICIMNHSFSLRGKSRGFEKKKKSDSCPTRKRKFTECSHGAPSKKPMTNSLESNEQYGYSRSPSLYDPLADELITNNSFVNFIPDESNPLKNEYQTTDNQHLQIKDRINAQLNNNQISKEDIISLEEQEPLLGPNVLNNPNIINPTTHPLDSLFADLPLTQEQIDLMNYCRSSGLEPFWVI